MARTDVHGYAAQPPTLVGADYFPGATRANQQMPTHNIHRQQRSHTPQKSLSQRD